MECFTKKVSSFQALIIFAKYLIFGVWQGSEYASGLLKSFCNSSTRDTQVRLIYAKLNIVFTPNKEFSPLCEAIHESTTSKLTKGKQKKEKWTILQFDIFLSFIFFISISTHKECPEQKWCVLIFTCIKLVASVLMWVHAIAQVKWASLGVVAIYICWHMENLVASASIIFLVVDLVEEPTNSLGTNQHNAGKYQHI